MDKNTIIGFVLIALVLIGFSWFSRPSEAQLEEYKRYNDSIVEVQKILAEEELKKRAEIKEMSVDSGAPFYLSQQGEDESVVLKNELVKVEIGTKGGTVQSATLLKYKDQEKEDLTLFAGKDALFELIFHGANRDFIANQYYFTPLLQTDSTVKMRLYADADRYIDFDYLLKGDAYIVDFNISYHNMDEILSASNKYIDINWKQRLRQLERSAKFENTRSELAYRTGSGDHEYMPYDGVKQENPEEPLQWIAYKNQFFSSVFIARNNFDNVTLNSETLKNGSGYLKNLSSKMRIATDPAGNDVTGMMFYFGPNQFQTMKSMDEVTGVDLDLEKLVSLGWVLFRWVNRIFTLPLFHWLSNWGLSMGVILLIMTIIVKLVVLPFTYKNFLSSAKMKALKPEIDKINAKYPNPEDALRKQQETMALYSQYGVSPMGGCLPMLLQIPILFALFLFVPSAIELRQQSFLWADDLSAYDDLISWSVNLPLLGNHISLFCLLMSATNILNTWFMQKIQPPMQQQEGMKFFKWFMYLMPVIFIFVLNDYPSGLNYYYFLSTVFSIGINYILMRIVTPAKVRAQLEKNLLKPKKKSSFMSRLEEMQKAQEEMQKNQRRR